MIAFFYRGAKKSQLAIVRYWKIVIKIVHSSSNVFRVMGKFSHGFCLTYFFKANRNYTFILNVHYNKHNPNLRNVFLELSTRHHENSISTKAQASYHQIHLLPTLVHHLSICWGRSPASQSLKRKRKKRKRSPDFSPITLIVILALLKSKLSITFLI